MFGTFAAFAGTLAAYKFFNIQVGDKFRTFVVAAMFGMVGLGLIELVLSFFGIGIGLFGFGGIGLLFAVAGLVLGVFMLILDFDFVEQGVAAGLPERESWRAAFGLTVSLVWIYTNLLRILAIFSRTDRPAGSSRLQRLREPLVLGRGARAVLGRSPASRSPRRGDGDGAAARPSVRAGRAGSRTPRCRRARCPGC